MTVRILAVSDRVLDQLYCSDVRQRYPDIDLIIGCGDLPYYYLEFLVSALDTNLLYVLGNHDGGPQYTIDGRILTGVQGGTNIHRRVLKKEGLLIAGLEGSMRYRSNSTLMYTEGEMIWNVFSMIPQLMWYRWRYGRSLDILVTHSPPFHIHDGKDIAHTGFKIFRNMMKWFQPKYLLHGHMHVYRNDVPRVTEFYQTTIINVYPYRVFEYGSI
ncbi:MAG: metallophosphoesterase [Candidatus Promineifilaceae bacterium]